MYRQISNNHNDYNDRILHVHATVCPLVIEDDVVQDFLWVDSCAKVADKVNPPYLRSLLLDAHVVLHVFVCTLYIAFLLIVTC